MIERTTKAGKRIVRHARVRAKVSGTAECPRLAVFRSNRYVSAQLIDDVSGKTLVHASGAKTKGGLIAQAVFVGKTVAELATKQGVKKVVFDRGGFLYAGVIKKVADSAREAGLTF